MHHQARAQFRIYLRKPVRHYQLYLGHVTSFPAGWSKFSSLWIQSLLSIPINHISHINATQFQHPKIICFFRPDASKSPQRGYWQCGIQLVGQFPLSPYPELPKTAFPPPLTPCPPGLTPYALSLMPQTKRFSRLQRALAPSPTPHAPCRLQACKSGQQISLANQTNCI